MISFLKKYWLIFLLAGVVLILFWLKTFLPSQPSPTPTPTKAMLPLPKFIPEQIGERIINYQFNLSLPADFPEQLPVYKILSLKTKTFPEIKPDLKGAAVISSDSAAIETARIFLQEKNIKETGLVQVSYRQVEKTETFLTTGSAQADIFVVNFWPKIEEVTIVSTNPTFPLTSVWIGKNGKVQKAFAATFSLEKFSSYPLRSLAAAQEDILNQKGVLVWLEKEETYGFSPPRNIVDIIIKKVSLAYYLSQEEFDFLEPIFVFEGKAILTGGESLGAAIYLPAVEESYLYP